jgi:hypothetical protein
MTCIQTIQPGRRISASIAGKRLRLAHLNTDYCLRAFGCSVKGGFTSAPTQPSSRLKSPSLPPAMLRVKIVTRSSRTEHPPPSASTIGSENTPSSALRFSAASAMSTSSCRDTPSNHGRIIQFETTATYATSLGTVTCSCPPE